MGAVANRFRAGSVEVAGATPDDFRSEIVIGVGIVDRGREPLLVERARGPLKRFTETAPPGQKDEAEAYNG